MKNISIFIIALLPFLPLASLQGADKPPARQTSHHCADDAIAQATRLLEFHFGPDDRITIEKKAKRLAPLKNPIGKNYYDVLEVRGRIYKGNYRMRFIYSQFPDQCVLVGQEILEYTK